MNPEITIWHTANAGVLIKRGRYTVGVDVFSKDSKGLYSDTPKDVREKLLKAIERREIETLIFTHEHEDHFCFEDVLEALCRNPDLSIISTEEVICRLQKMESYIKNAHMISSKQTGSIQIEMPGYSLTLFNSVHMGEKYRNIQNLVCMIEADGKRIVIPGDAWPKPELFERISRWSSRIDLIIVPFPLVGIPSNRKNILRYLKILKILAVHLPRREKDTQGWIASTKRVCENVEDGLPKAIFGEPLGKIYTMPERI